MSPWCKKTDISHFFTCTQKRETEAIVKSRPNKKARQKRETRLWCVGGKSGQRFHSSPTSASDSCRMKLETSELWEVACNKELGILIMINMKVHNSNIKRFSKQGLSFMSLKWASYIVANLTWITSENSWHSLQHSKRNVFCGTKHVNNGWFKNRCLI